jgi:hypothetical protein
MSDELPVAGIASELRPVGRAGLGEDVAHVALNGFQAYDEGIGDLGVAFAGHDKAENLYVSAFKIASIPGPVLQ